MDKQALAAAFSAIAEQFQALANELEVEQVEETPKPAKGKTGKGKPRKEVEEQEHTREELGEKLRELVKAQDKQAAVDALARFGCKKLGDVKEEQIDEFHAYLEKKIDNEDDPADSDTEKDGGSLFD